jgi:hypothetical protein
MDPGFHGDVEESHSEEDEQDEQDACVAGAVRIGYCRRVTEGGGSVTLWVRRMRRASLRALAAA